MSPPQANPHFDLKMTLSVLDAKDTIGFDPAKPNVYSQFRDDIRVRLEATGITSKSQAGKAQWKSEIIDVVSLHAISGTFYLFSQALRNRHIRPSGNRIVQRI